MAIVKTFHNLNSHGSFRLRNGQIGFQEVEDAQDADRFIKESTVGALQKIIQEQQVDSPGTEPEKGLGPDIASMGLANSLEDTSNAFQASTAYEVNFTFDDIDDAELDTYIMTEHEFECKKGLWHQRNADYLEEQRAKAEKLQKEREEGKPEKKRKRTSRKKAIGPANSAGEAIEKILQEKKISSKINYDVLKSLNAATLKNEPSVVEEETVPTTSEAITRRRLSSASNLLEQAPVKAAGRKSKILKDVGLPFLESPSKGPTKTELKPEKMEKPVKKEVVKKEESASTLSEEEMDEYYEEEEQPPDETANEIGVLQMLRQHREDEDGEGEFGYGYFEEEY
ncbi:transcription factor IIIB 90 kDa subunit [Anoplophora glabripennis]|uniref:transcription factor IIIB 90 kDa subunit n=1 Tax=Anoplophora glabripennis TaxID=217634 RepID=UPI000C7679D7|nr:transcription factor IIIB 90 kDa subunit [Anoplophora glabripennis]